MKFTIRNSVQRMHAGVLVAAVLACASVQAQTAPGTGAPAATQGSNMHKGMAGSHDMKAPMMKGMDDMQKMTSSGNIDKDFAMMMTLHHQQAVYIAETEIAQGKSPEMKAMAKRIIAAQKKEMRSLTSGFQNRSKLASFTAGDFG